MIDSLEKYFCKNCVITHGLSQKATGQPTSFKVTPQLTNQRQVWSFKITIMRSCDLRLLKRLIIWSDFCYKMSTIIDYHEAVDCPGPEGSRNTMHQIFVTSERISISDFGPFFLLNHPGKQLLFIEGALIRNLQCQCVLIVNQLSSKSSELGHRRDLHHVWYYQLILRTNTSAVHR